EVAQRGRQARVALVEAVDLDLLHDHAQHRAVAQRAVAELPATLHGQAEVAAVSGTGMRTQRRAQGHLAFDVEVEAGVAELAIEPAAGVALPAQVATDRNLGLVPFATAPAPVVGLRAVTDEAAIDQAVAAPVHADRQCRAGASVVVAVGVALEVPAQVGPPARTGRIAAAGDLRVQARGTVAAGACGRVR